MQPDAAVPIKAVFEFHRARHERIMVGLQVLPGNYFALEQKELDLGCEGKIPPNRNLQCRDEVFVVSGVETYILGALIEHLAVAVESQLQFGLLDCDRCMEISHP